MADPVSFELYHDPNLCNFGQCSKFVVVSKNDFSQGAEYKVFLGVFLMILAFFHSKIWAKFHFGTFKPYD